jgi:hypothetical protein
VRTLVDGEEEVRRRRRSSSAFEALRLFRSLYRINSGVNQD